MDWVGVGLLGALCVTNPLCLYMTMLVIISWGACTLAWNNWNVTLNVFLGLGVLFTLRIAWNCGVTLSLKRYFKICRLQLPWRERIRLCFQSDRDNIDKLLLTKSSSHYDKKHSVNLI